jgi:hypothetical protein
MLARVGTISALDARRRTSGLLQTHAHPLRTVQEILDANQRKARPVFGMALAH